MDRFPGKGCPVARLEPGNAGLLGGKVTSQGPRAIRRQREPGNAGLPLEPGNAGLPLGMGALHGINFAIHGKSLH